MVLECQSVQSSGQFTLETQWKKSGGTACALGKVGISDGDMIKLTK